MRKRGKKTLLESASEIAESVLPAIESAVETVHDKAAPILAEGRAMASEKLADGKALASEKFADGRALAHDKRALASEKARRGKRRAAAKAAAFAAAAPADKISALKSAEPEPEHKGGKLKKVLLLGVLIGIGTAVAKRLQGGKSGHDNWQSTYTPAPAPTPRPGAHAADDRAAASPDEALADQASEPHPDTTPDDPAEVVELVAVPDPEPEPEPEPEAEAAPEAEAEAAPEEPLRSEAAETPGAAPESNTPYGEGSALPLADGSAPGSSYTIKGNVGSKLFHTRESPYYDRTKAEVWFTNEVAAEAAGFRHWKASKD